MKKRKPVKTKIKAKKNPMLRNLKRGKVGRGTIFIVVILISLIFVGYIMVGGTIPETIPAPRTDGIVAVDLKQKYPQEPGLQMHTFKGATVTPYPTSNLPPPGSPGGPSGAAGASPVPIVGATIFTGDFNPGNTSQFNEIASCPPNTEVSVKQDVVKEGNFSGHFKVGGPAECLGDKSHRAEVASHDPNALTHEGDERWYSWSTQFATDFPNPNGGWFIIMQWHSGSGSPPLAINVENDGDVVIGGDGVKAEKKSLGVVKPGVWTDYVLHVKFSKNPAVGFVEGWENGFLKVPKFNRATMSSNENYLKMGIYRDPSNGATVHELWHDGLKVTKP